MHPYTLDTEMVAPVSVQEAFAVFENPYNLARITPPWLRFRVTSREKVVVRKGAEIAYAIRWMGIPIRWRTLITEYDPPFRFVDEQAAGPYRWWRHLHTFAPGEHGTRVRDHVEYVLPFGPLGRLVHRIFVRRQLEGIFAFRRRALAEIWSGTTARAAR